MVTEEDLTLSGEHVKEQQLGSCSSPPLCRQNSRGKVLVIRERSLYSKASQFWNNSFPHALVT